MGRNSSIKIINNFKNKLIENINIQKVILFGSRAWGKPKRWSDFDLIIVSSDFKKINFLERAAKMYNYWDINYPVDFICLTPEEFNKLKKGITIVSEALKNGIVIS